MMIYKAKKLIAGITAIVCMLGMTACQKSETDNMSSNALKVKTIEKSVSQETQDNEDPMNDTVGEIDISPNISDTAEFNKVEIRGDTIDIYYKQLSRFLEDTGFSYCEYSSYNFTQEGYTFFGKGYGVQYNPYDLSSFTGNKIALEIVKKTEKTQYCDIKDTSEIDDSMIIKALCFDTVKSDDSSSSEQRYDYDVSFYGGIVLGDERESVEQKIGTGTVSKDSKNVVYYKTTKNTMIAEYASDKLIKVTIINNYDLSDISE